MHKLKAALVGLLCLGVVTGCSTNTNPGNVVFTTQATLQLAVGTLNDPSGTLATQVGALPAGPVSLNAIATFRNQLGNSAFGAAGATGTFPGQAALTPIPTDPACNFTTGAGCNIGSPAGVGWALFGYGQSTSLLPFPLPPGFAPNGMLAGAPAWAAPGSPTGMLVDLTCGACPGWNFFPIGAGGTQYSLVDMVTVNGQVQKYSANATLNAAPTVLTQPALATYAPAVGTGGGTFTFGPMPANATEQVVVVLSSPVGFAGVVAMAEVCTAAVGCPNTGSTAVLPPNTLTPGAYTCFVMAADFPWVEAGMVNAPRVGTATPVIVGALGNADMSVSAMPAAGNCTQT